MKSIIKLKNVSKTFNTKDGVLDALKNVSLDIDKGNIFGIIGMSGAGKSTLIRCLNFLEVPSNGSIEINGKNLSELKNKDLRLLRSKMSMIFQHFNLLMQKSVLDNICFPLLLLGYSKTAAREKALNLLKIVNLEAKKDAYPSQLSGGQKQRVAIARALANDPEILLCDEATSALDPQTTKSILSLLKDINKNYGITIVLITHEMSVVEEICSHVAILANGELVETGLVDQLFSSPKSAEGKKLIYGTSLPSFESKNKCIRIVFTENSSFEPVIANMVLQFKQTINIMRANTKNIDGIAKGEMILQLPKDEAISAKMIQFLLDRNLVVEEYEVINNKWETKNE